MDRKQFIKATGTFISATALTRMFGTTSLLTLTSCSGTKAGTERDDYHQFDKPIMQALAIGLNAPSAHNTQPWKFKLLSDTSAALYVDETRLLPQTDPPTRQIHISAGCFLETVAIGATMIGHTATIQLFPSGEYTQQETGSKPVATLQLVADKSIVTHPLAEYIFNRKTSRLPYEGTLITFEEMEALLMDTATQFSKVDFIIDAEKMKPYLDIFKEAMKIESFNLPTNEETRRMFRFNAEEIDTKRDGLTFEGQGTTGIAKFFTKRAVKNTEESWNKKANIEAGLEKFNKAVDSAKGIVFWTTPTNNLNDWVNSGRDVARFWLALTKHKLYAHPLNQGIQEYAAMDGLRQKLDGMMSIKAGEKIQMIVRIGRSDTPFRSFRRHLNDVKQVV